MYLLSLDVFQLVFKAFVLPSKFTPHWGSLMFSFCCCFCCCFAQGLYIHPVINNSFRQWGERRVGWNEEWGAAKHCVRVCICICVYAFWRTWCCKSLFCRHPLATTACNRPSVKARQLTIRGGGQCGMGDYARGLVSYTITSHVADRHESRCISTALYLFVRAHRPEHTQREEQAAALWYSPKQAGGKIQSLQRQSVQGDRRRTREV